MKIIKLILNKYKRFTLTKPDVFEYVPEKKVQIILGTNGSGKSSLLSELTPIPPNKGDFRPGGCKEIHIEHNGKLYVLTGDFTKSPRYSFSVDGEELNPSGTLSIQKTLVSQHFDVDKDIYKLVSGKSSFSAMTLGERRKWFTELLDSNLEYALGVYKRLTEHKRDLEGTIKILRTKATREKENLLKPSDIIKIEEEISFLKKYKEDLLSRKEDVENFNVRDYIDSHNEKLMNTINSYRLNSNPPIRDNPNNTTSMVDKINSEVKVLQQQADALHQQLSKLHTNKEEISTTEVSTLEQELDKVKQDIGNLMSLIPEELELTLTDVEEFVRVYQTVYVRLSELFADMPHDPDRIYHKDNLNKLNEERLKLIKHIDTDEKLLESKIEEKNKLDALYKQDDVECPKCHHTWKPGYTDREHHLQLSKEIEELHHRITTRRKRVNEIEDHLKLIQERTSKLSEVYNIFNRWDQLQTVWKYIERNTDLYTGGEPVISTLYQLYDISTKVSPISNLLKEYTSIKKEIEQAKKIDKLQIDNLKNQIDTLTEQYHNVKDRIRTLEKKARFYTKVTNQLHHIQREFDNLNEELENRKDMYSKSSKLLEQHVLNNVITLINNILVEKEKMYNETMLFSNTISELEKQIDELTAKKEVTDMIIEALSPKQGLIGKVIIPKINAIIDAVNEKISTVWTYPLEIVKYDPETITKLDYKLKVLVNGTEIVDDIKDTSSAMKEIIDLAFRLVVLSYKQLDVPLYLDEFGKSMDSIHRTRIYQMLVQTADVSPYTHVFIVSHFVSSYGSVSNADFVIMSEDNIDIPGGVEYNKVVTIQ